MNRWALIIILAGGLLSGGCSKLSSQLANNPAAECGTIEVAENLESYNQLAIPEKQFVGILEDNGPNDSGVATTLQRYSRYAVSGQPLAPISQDLSAYVGRQVIVIGRQYQFELEGQLLDELWAKSISCR
ncbi:hypothetical protein JXA59_01440 [Patescibacteria group bacterium]|nr:hypothetical protein [Patescibacteria group bacterium]